MTRTRRWQVAPAVPAPVAEQLPGRSRAIKQVLFNRGFRQAGDASDFYARDLARLHPAELLPGLPAAAARLAQARDRGERVVVFGDYDADGVTGTAILVRTLRAAGMQVSWYLPDRVGEGYGLNHAALAQLHGGGASLVVSVDNGITAVEEAARARELGLDLIITDHHHVPAVLPDAILVHPRVPGSEYPFGGLSGAGVALKLSLHLASAWSLPAELGDELLQLAAIGTVADVVPLVDENRRIVHHGLRLMNRAPSAALAALLRVCDSPPGTVDTDTIGYRIGPRINAAGRMEDAGPAVRLLLSDGFDETAVLAAELEQHNRRRQQETEAALELAAGMVGEDPAEALLVLAAPEFALGLVGLVAGRLSERFQRPAFVARESDGQWRGSVRWPNPEGPGAIGALEAVADLLDRFGGHRAAAGFTLDAARGPEFRRRLLELPGLPDPTAELAPLEVDATLDPGEIDLDLRQELDKLAPFGPGNPEPLLALLGAEVRDVRPLTDGRHLRIAVRGRFGAVHGVAFDRGPELSWLRPGMSADLAFALARNTYGGTQALELRLVDLRQTAPA
ncbi:MAG: single-stranded-DNA-specific exonuclease RecJ [Candidatus Dormibacteria bacterium]